MLLWDEDDICTVVFHSVIYNSVDSPQVYYQILLLESNFALNNIDVKMSRTLCATQSDRYVMYKEFCTASGARKKECWITLYKNNVWNLRIKVMNFFSWTQNLSCTLCTLGWSNFGLLICDKYICSFLKIKIWGEDLHPVLENLLIKSKKSSLIRSRWVAKKKLLP